MGIIKVNINNVYARLAVDGKLKVIPLPESPHYKFLTGDEDPYIKYMEIVKQPEHSVAIYRKLIVTFNIEKSKHIKCRLHKGKYIIYDGFHRSCIFLFKEYKKIEILVIN